MLSQQLILFKKIHEVTLNTKNFKQIKLKITLQLDLKKLFSQRS